MGEIEHDLSTVIGFEGSDQQYSDVSEFTQFLNADNHLSSEKYGDNWVFWTPETYGLPESPLIKKIKLSLSALKKYYCTLVQFWALKVEGNCSYLTTSEQPFALRLFKGMSWYREHCLNHKYIVEDDEVGVKEEQLGGVGRVFLNGYPEYSPDLRLYSTKELPFRDHAARCGARGYFVLPIFDVLKSECYGVLELLSFYDFGGRLELQLAVEEAGLRSTHLYTDDINWMLQNNFDKKSEIAKMLLAAIEVVPQLHMAQAWVCCKQCANTNTDLCCLERAAFVTAATKKVNDTCMHDMMLFDYLRACQWWNLQGIIAKMAMLKNIKSWFSRNICDFSICENPLAHYAQQAGLSLYFAIRLESVHNSDDIYYVEFFLQRDSRQDLYGASYWHLLFGVMETELKSYKVTSSDQQELVIEIHKDMLSGSTELIEHNFYALKYGIQEHAQGRNHQFSKESNVLILMNDDLKEYSSELDFQKHFHMNVHYSCLKSHKNGKYTYLFWCPQREELGENKVNYSSFLSTQEKIKWLLGKLLFQFKMTSYSLIQFWAPIMNEDRCYLATSGQPFVLGGLHKGLGFFRKRCMEHQYFVDQGAKAEEIGPPGRVFKSGHPEVTHDIRLYSSTEFQLKDDAVFCHLRTYLAFPVFDQMLKCVGVLEFVGIDEVVELNNLKRIQKAVKEQHLSLGHCNFKPSFKVSVALTEIEQALKLVTRIPQLHIVEAWVPHNKCASTRNSLKCMERVKHSTWLEKDPFDLVDLFDLVETGKGIVGTVLTSENKSCYCRNSGFITEQSQPHHAQQKMLDVCFAICLQSSYTGDLPYVLKFFLNQGPTNYEYLCSFLYFLLPILKQELKSFKVATGKQLGEELVVDIIEFSQVNQPTSFQFGKPNMFPVKCQIVQYGQQEHQELNDEQVNEMDHVTNVVAGGKQSNTIAAYSDEKNEKIVRYGQQTHQEPNDEQVNEMDHVTSVVAEGKQSNTYLDEKNETSRKVDGGKRKKGLHITLEDLKKEFGKSRKDAAENLSVSISTFKRACRSHDIHRWPSKEKYRMNPSLFMTANENERDRDTRPSTSNIHQNVPQTNSESAQNLIPLPEIDEVIKAKYESNISKLPEKWCTDVKAAPYSDCKMDRLSNASNQSTHGDNRMEPNGDFFYDMKTDITEIQSDPPPPSEKDQELKNIWQQPQLHVSHTRDNFETHVVNIGSANSEGEVQNVGSDSEKKSEAKVTVPYNLLPNFEELATYLLKEKDQMALLVDYGNWELCREHLATLRDEEWISSAVIDCVAYMCTFEAREYSNFTPHWYFPAMFSNLAMNDTYSNTKINKTIFGPEKDFRGDAAMCETITIPINDGHGHWFISTINMEQKKVYIADTLRTIESDVFRESMVKKVVTKLEQLSGTWDDGSFKHNNWANTFTFEYYSWVPQQPNSYDCGLYVCLIMMYRRIHWTSLTKEQSVKAREAVAVKLYRCKKNVALCVNAEGTKSISREPRSVKVKFLVRHGLCQFNTQMLEVVGLTLDTVRNEVRPFLIDGMYVEQVKLKGTIPLSGGLIDIDTDEDLQMIISMSIDLEKDIVVMLLMSF